MLGFTAFALTSFLIGSQSVETQLPAAVQNLPTDKASQRFPSAEEVLNKSADELSEEVNDEPEELWQMQAKEEVQSCCKLKLRFSPLAQEITMLGLLEGGQISAVKKSVNVKTAQLLETSLISPLVKLDMDLFSFSDAPALMEKRLFDPKDFDIPVVYNDAVEKWVNFFTGRGRSYFKRWLARSSRYEPLYRQIMKEHDVPEDTVYLSMIESGFNDQAYSRAKAAGPWQFMSATGRMYGLKSSGFVDDRRDFIKATHAAARHLHDLYERFGDWYLAWASYNAGAGKLSRAVNMYNSSDFFHLADKSYLKAETKNYVPKLLAAAIVAKQAEKFGFRDIEWQAPFEYDVVAVRGSLRLKEVAESIGCTEESLKVLNPSLRYLMTPPDESIELRVPKGKSEQLLAVLDDLLAKPQLAMRVYQARKNERLTTIALRFGSSVDLIREYNQLNEKESHVALKKELIIPVLSNQEKLTENVQQTTKRLAARPAVEKVKVVKKSLKAAPLRRGVRKHVILRGESLQSIAQKYGVAVKELKSWNKNVSNQQLKTGLSLIVKP